MMRSFTVRKDTYKRQKNRQHVLLLQPINGKMELISQIQLAASQALQREYQFALPAGEVLVNETKPEFEGDYTVVLFSFIKQLKKKPEELGNELGRALVAANPELFSAFNV